MTTCVTSVWSDGGWEDHREWYRREFTNNKHSKGIEEGRLTWYIDLLTFEPLVDNLT